MANCSTVGPLKRADYDEVHFDTALVQAMAVIEKLRAHKKGEYWIKPAMTALGFPFVNGGKDKTVYAVGTLAFKFGGHRALKSEHEKWLEFKGTPFERYLIPTLGFWELGEKAWYGLTIQPLIPQHRICCRMGGCDRSACNIYECLHDLNVTDYYINHVRLSDTSALFDYV